jgi:hypothetical protein
MSTRGHSLFASSTIVNPNRNSSRFPVMNRNHIISPRNTMAISAMLMLSAGMVHAQEVTVPVTEAPNQAVEAPTPTIVIPTVAAEPEAAPVAATTASLPRAGSSRTPASRTTVRSEARAAVPSTPAQQRSEPGPASTPVPETAPPAAEPLAASPAETSPAQTSPAADNNRTSDDWAVPVGAAATLLVVGGAVIAMRRRRRPYEEDVDFVPPVINRPVGRPERRVGEGAVPPSPSQPAFGLAPARIATPTEREALIERIVASPPDAANPFTSRKARRRRARIMVQSMAARSEVPTTAQAPATSADASAMQMPEYAHV